MSKYSSKFFSDLTLPSRTFLFGSEAQGFLFMYIVLKFRASFLYSRYIIYIFVNLLGQAEALDS